MRGWFKLFSDDSAFTQIYALSGKQDFLQNQSLRTHAFWTITKMGVGINPPENLPDASKYRETSIHDSFPNRVRSFFETDDQTLQELSALEHMKPFQKHMPSGTKPHVLVDCFVVGQCGVDNGIDLQNWADMSTECQLDKEGGKGCKTVSLVRFGIRACASHRTSDGATIHGGAIGAVMDEATAECMKFWIRPNCSTRKIQHQFIKMSVPYATYRIDCTIENIKNDGLLVEVKGVMVDVLNQTCCVSIAEMIDLKQFGNHDNTWW